MIGEEILSKMDKTLDQLIANVEAVQYASKLELEEYEIEAINKTQTSLLAHLMYLDKNYEESAKKIKTDSRKEIYQKLREYEKLNAHFVKEIGNKWKIAKRKKKLKTS